MDHVTLTMEDIGIREDGSHQEALTPVESSCLDSLTRAGKGRANALSADLLAALVFDLSDMEQTKRNLRELVNHLICTHRIPICSMPGYGGGYWLPDTPEEVEAVYQARRKRAFTGLVKMSEGRKSAYVDIMEQLTLGFDEPEGNQAIERLRLVPDSDRMPAWIKLVTRLLDRIDRDPQRYASEIRALQNMYGNIFVPRKTMQELRTKLAETQELLKKIA